MNAEQIATLAEFAAQTAAILAGEITINLSSAEVAAIQMELAEPFEASPTFYHYGKRGGWNLELPRAARVKRAALLSAHIARIASIAEAA